MPDQDKDYGVFSSGATFYPEHMTVAHGMALLTNKHTSAVSTGDVLVISTSSDRSMVATTTPGDTRRVVIVPASVGSGGAGTKTIAANEDGFVYVCSGQYVPAVKVVSEVSVGEYLVTSSTPLYAQGCGVSVAQCPTPPSGAFAISLASIAGSGTVPALTIPAAPAQYTAGGRLSADPNKSVREIANDKSIVYSSDTIYYVPHVHNVLPLYTRGAWAPIRLSSPPSLNISGLTSDKNYDVYAYLLGSNVALAVYSWDTDTSRSATSYPVRNSATGVWVLNADPAKRYLGTIRKTSSGVRWQATAIDIWNVENAVPIRVSIFDSTTHTYSSAAWRAWNNSATNKIEIVVGMQGVAQSAQIWGRVQQAATAGNARLGIGISSFTSNATVGGGAHTAAPASLDVTVAASLYTQQLGYFYFGALEYGNANGPTFPYVTLHAEVFA